MREREEGMEAGKEEEGKSCHSNYCGRLTTNRHNPTIWCAVLATSALEAPLQSSNRGFTTLLTASSPHAWPCRKMRLTTLCKLFGCFSAVYLNIPSMCFTADTRYYVDREWMYEMYIRVMTASKDSLSVYLINACYLWSLSMENKTSDLKCPCLYFRISGMFSCLGYLLDYGIFLISYLLCLVR